MIAKILGVCVICAVFCVMLKQWGRNDAAIMLALAGSVYALTAIFSALAQIVDEVKMIAEEANLDNGIFVTVLKITGIGYITQNAASLCRDAGEGALSEKIELSGKIMICMISVPSVKALFEVISNLL